MAAQGCDVYLMWPDTVAATAATVSEMTERAAAHRLAVDPSPA